MAYFAAVEAKSITMISVRGFLLSLSLSPALRHPLFRARVRALSWRRHGPPFWGHIYMYIYIEREELY